MKKDFRRRIDRVKEEVSIEAVVEQAGGVIQGGYGEWQRTLCPFHNDSVASASTNLIAGAFVCQACGVKGDVISIAKFYLEMQNEPASFMDALAWLEELGGLSETLPD